MLPYSRLTPSCSRCVPQHLPNARPAGEPPVTAAPVPAQGMRAVVSATASAAALLQCELPPGGTEVVALEVPGAVPGHSGGQGKRNGQSRRYRERVRSRKPAEKEAVSEPARA